MTHNTREVEEVIKEFDSKFFIGGKNAYGEEKPLLFPAKVEVRDWLRTTLHHQLQKAREASYFKGYNAGLADGTDKPLLAIEQMLQKAREEEKEKVKKMVQEIGGQMYFDHERLRAYIKDHSELDQDSK